MSVRPTGPRQAAAWLLLDVVAVIVFATVGRVSHDEGVTVGGVLHVAWPFAVGTALGWALSRAWSRPLDLVAVGVPVWAGTVVVGLLLRAVTGAGVAASFVVVATLVLGAFLLGWRLVAGRLTGRRGLG